MAQPRATTPTLGWLDSLKDAFDNDERLEQKGGVDVTPGKTKRVAAYVRQKDSMRKQQQSQCEDER